MREQSINGKFKYNEQQVYRGFKEIIEKDATNPRPVFRKEERKDRLKDEMSLDELTAFWKEKWEEKKGFENKEWINEVEDRMRKAVGREEKQEISESSFCHAIRKKKNWSRPGTDGIVNYWWKMNKSVHRLIFEEFRKLVKGEDSPEWMTEGRTVMLEKEGERSAANKRPITCLQTLYKWYSGTLQIRVRGVCGKEFSHAKESKRCEKEMLGNNVEFIYR